ncbi:MAG: class I SAM-dependent methyltransferase [Pseudomonadota bacterium]
MALSNLAEFLKARRQRVLDRNPLASDPMKFLFSATSFALWQAAKAPTRLYATGLVLDAGSGRGGWRAVIEAAGGTRETLDIAERPGERLDWVADLTAMPEVPSARFDSVVCHQVLEHVPRPHAAMAEIARVLKPGGHLVLSVPHLSRLHEMPHDYFRYTRSGLRVLMEDAGLELREIRPYGGVFSFLHHQLATLVLGLASLTGPIYPVFVAINAPFSLLAAGLDWLIDRNALAPNGYVALARKPAAGAPG